MRARLCLKQLLVVCFQLRLGGIVGWHEFVLLERIHNEGT